MSAPTPNTQEIKLSFISDKNNKIDFKIICNFSEINDCKLC